MARHDRDADGSTRTGTDTPTGTHAGADVTSRMTGTDRTDGTQALPTDGHRAEHAAPVTTGTTTDRYEERVIPERTKKAKTSAAATFALVFGLAALFCALTGILAPAAVLFGVIGLVLAIAGFKMTKRLGVTGRGLAVGGLLTSLLGLVLGAAVLAGAAVYVNDQGLDRLQQQFDDAVENAPSGGEIVNDVENAVQ